MAFSFPGTPPAAPAGGTNSQSGADLEEIQTEVWMQIQLLQAIFANHEYRILGGLLLLENQKYSCFLHHGQRISYLLLLHP
jgi:hypothetical protein